MVLVKVFSNIQDFVCHEFILEGAIINKVWYEEVLTHILKHPEIWAAKTWVLVHDNTSAHAKHYPLYWSSVMLCSSYLF